jgi:hypothetical protein
VGNAAVFVSMRAGTSPVKLRARVHYLGWIKFPVLCLPALPEPLRSLPRLPEPPGPWLGQVSPTMAERRPVTGAPGSLSARSNQQPRVSRLRVVRKLSLICGILSSLLNVAMNIVGAVRYEGYSSVSQTVSELSAKGDPTRRLWVLLAILRIPYG